MAFPDFDAKQIKKVLLSFIDTGKFSKPDRAPKIGLVERFNFGLLPRFNLSLVARFNFGLPNII